MHGSGDCSIIGVSARLAGCDSPAEFWAALTDRRSLVGALDDARWALTSSPAAPRWASREAARGTFLRDIERFDAGLFGLPPAAAMFADPRQRLLLEAVWCAIEDAGLRRA